MYRVAILECLIDPKQQSTSRRDYVRFFMLSTEIPLCDGIRRLTVCNVLPYS